MEDEPLQQVAELLANPVQVVKWLEARGQGSQKSYARALFDRLINEAAQPKSVSGQACVRLCGLVEQSSKSESEELRTWAFSQDLTLDLFNFFIEWNESDHHRSMKLVLDLIVQFIKRNPDKEDASITKACLLDTLISIVIGRSAKPVAKSAIKTLDHLLSKGIFTLGDIHSGYVSQRQELAQSDDIEVWRMLMIDLFHWMRLHFVCPTSGRFIVCVYRGWRTAGYEKPMAPSLETWYQWLLEFLLEEPSLLESIKNYIFLPLFKADRVEGLRFLAKVNGDKVVSTASNLDMDMPALLQLAALETGKKVGLVEEPGLSGDEGQGEEYSSIVVHEKVLESVLAHPSHEVRALALSLLVTSPSTTRPYSYTALELLRKHLASIFADADAKFRVEVSGKVRDMFRRVRGAIHVLKRSIPRARAKAQKGAQSQVSPDLEATSQPILYRSNLVVLPEAQLTRCLQYHEEFLRWYIGFLCGELTPTASYQRHIASLKAVMLITRLEGEASKTWETEDDQRLFFDLFDEKWTRALVDLLMDPYDDVREISASALQRFFSDERYRQFALTSHAANKSAAETLTEVSRRAEELARRTSRADHSDGASRVSQLLYRFLGCGQQRVAFLAKLISELERKTLVAERDLGRAVLESPLHGDFASLNHVWQVASELEISESDIEAVRELQSTLVSCCERVWKAVRDVLCDDSPEGHLPQELEELEGLDTKDLLSFSFRAVHESSNLMRTIVLAIRNRSRGRFISPSQDLFESIGNLTFNQLSSLRHRGAFTTVAMTFATCCQQAKQLDHGESLLDTWYQGTMTAIFSQASTTRRSAGIPSMMTGILSANASNPSFEHVMESLMSIASKTARVSETDGSNLPQVHAYNCLKDIFRNSTLTALGNKSANYLPQCLELAASGLRSEVWAIRNCGLILLRSLIDCLFGSQESKAMIESGWDGKANRIAYHRYPNLPPVLSSLLKSGHQILSQTGVTVSAAESVFPALDIIRRAGPPELLRDEIQVDVAVYLSSPVWHVRELAARTLCSCLLHERWLQTIKDVLQDALKSPTSIRQNHLHGVLLTLGFVIERLREVSADRLMADLPELTLFLVRSAKDLDFPYCPEIAAAYFEVVNHIWAFEKTNSRPLSPFKVTMPASTASALLRKQRAIHDVFTASSEDDAVERLRVLLLDQKVGIDSFVTALETLPKLWTTNSTSEQPLIQLCKFYIDVCLKVGHVEAQTVAVHNFNEIMDQLIHRGEVDKLPTTSLVELWITLPSRPMNPALSNAVIGVSGCIVAALRASPEAPSIDLQNWGSMMADAGMDDKTFDTRFAAVRSLRSFFRGVGKSCASEESLPALLALYDALNDDDDEVRNVGSTAVNSIVGEALVPLEAANSLLRWLALHFRNSPRFKSEVASRMVGHYGVKSRDANVWESAEDELAKAFEVDDSLFAIEEQNLFVDEVRETKRWVGVFESLHWDDGDETLASLDRWMQGGIGQLGKLMEREDGPLGWASNPQVFAICTLLVRGSEAMAKQQCATPGLRDAIASTRGALRAHNTHVSGLLTEAWEEGAR